MPEAKPVLDVDGRQPRPVVAIEGVCAWPNLTLLPDGTIVALVYNQPSHGQMPGDVDCWASTDDGRTWQRRGTAAPRGSATENRMNIAAGLTADGELIMVASGWSEPGNPEADGRPHYGQILPAWVSRSTDGGSTWTIDREGFPNGPQGRPLVPYGDIMPGADGFLRVSAYSPFNYVVRGDGVNWTAPVPVASETRFNETAILHLGGGRWLAAARRGSRGLTILASADDAATWETRKEVTDNLMHPGHLLRLADGAILLAYGNRNRPDQGIEVLFSDDDGHTWPERYRVLDTRPGDMGYPSSVQLADGRILTAYYAGGIEDYRGYHMGTTTWDPARTRQQRTP